MWSRSRANNAADSRSPTRAESTGAQDGDGENALRMAPRRPRTRTARHEHRARVDRVEGRDQDRSSCEHESWERAHRQQGAHDVLAHSEVGYGQAQRGSAVVLDRAAPRARKKRKARTMTSGSKAPRTRNALVLELDGESVTQGIGAWRSEAWAHRIKMNAGLRTFSGFGDRREIAPEKGSDLFRSRVSRTRVCPSKIDLTAFPVSAGSPILFRKLEGRGCDDGVLQVDAKASITVTITAPGDELLTAANRVEAVFEEFGRSRSWVAIITVPAMRVLRGNDLKYIATTADG